MAYSKRLLVADDSLTIQKVIRLALSSEGYEIQTLADGQLAIEHLSTFRPDAVLIDVALPNKNAFELKREVNTIAELKDIKFVLMSSAFETVDESQAQEVGFSGRLTKPFDPALLRQIIQSVLGKGLNQKVEQNKLGSQQNSTRPKLPEMPTFPPPSLPSSFSNDIPEMGVDFPPFSNDSTHSGMFPSLPSMDPRREKTNPLISKMTEDSFKDVSHHEDDIKKLTESTIKMSGLDDFKWSIQEPTLLTQKSSPPLGGLPLDFGSDFSSPTDFSGVVREEPTAKIFVPNLNSQDPLTQSNVNSHSQPLSSTQRPSADVVGAEEIRQIVKKEVHQLVETTIRKILPDLAERILKEEIHKLLNESH